MRPGVPHFVYGLEDAITHGGHFYSSSLIQATVQSLIHTFVLSDFISNTFHNSSRLLLRRIVLLWGLGVVALRVDDDGKKCTGISLLPMLNHSFRRRIPSPA